MRVVIPSRGNFEDAQKFLYTKLDWIKQHLPKIEKQEENLTRYDENTQFRTFAHTLCLIAYAGTELKARITKDQLQVYYPAHCSLPDPEVQAYIRQAIEATYRSEAKQYLPQRVQYFAFKFNFNYNKVVIKKAGTRWGSCSYQNNINLNLHLMRLPDHLRDYVILHELAHTVEKNHGPGFWALLNKISGDAYGLDREMKQYRIDIY